MSGPAKMPSGERMLDDLAEHVAHHASIGFAECRDLDPPEAAKPEFSGRTDDMDREIVVMILGRRFTITIEECGQ